MGDSNGVGSAFQARASRHLLRYGCDFANFVPVRGQRLLPLRRRRRPDARLHFRPDELDPRALPSRDRRHDPRGGRQARSSLLRHDLRTRRRPGGKAGGAGAGTVEGHAAVDRRRIERSRHQARQDRHRKVGDRDLHEILSRRDGRLGGGDLQGRADGRRSHGPRLLRNPGAECLQAALRGRGLAPRARRRLRAGRCAVHGQSRSLHRRADPEQRRRDRPAAGLSRRPEGALRGSRHAAHPGRGADGARPHRHDVRVPEGRCHTGHPDPVENPWAPAWRCRPS